MNKKELEKHFIDRDMSNMDHSIAVCKKYIKGTVIVIGQVGMVTAYTPEQNMFAVHFGYDSWISFNETEEEFLEKFEVELYKELK